MKKMLKSNKGFTLVEMLIVLVVISFLVLLVIPQGGEIIQRAEQTACDAIDESNSALAEVSSALDMDLTINADGRCS